MTFFKHCCFLKRKNKVKHFDPSKNEETDSPKINNFVEEDTISCQNNKESVDPRSPLKNRSPRFMTILKKKNKNKIEPNEIFMQDNKGSLPNQISNSPYKEDRNNNLIFAGLPTQNENKSKIYYNNNVTHLPENLAT